MSAKPREASGPELVLLLPDAADVGALSELLGAVTVAALIAEPTPASFDALQAARHSGVPVLSAGGALARADFDGVHATGPLGERLATIAARRPPAMVGACASDRHEAMLLAEAGADYVAFAAGELGADVARDHAAWWQALFEVPVIVIGPLADAAANAATGAEFVAIDDLWDQQDRLAALETVVRRLAGEPA